MCLAASLATSQRPWCSLMLSTHLCHLLDCLDRLEFPLVSLLNPFVPTICWRVLMYCIASSASSRLSKCSMVLTMHLLCVPGCLVWLSFFQVSLLDLLSLTICWCVLMWFTASSATSNCLHRVLALLMRQLELWCTQCRSLRLLSSHHQEFYKNLIWT